MACCGNVGFFLLSSMPRQKAGDPDESEHRRAKSMLGWLLEGRWKPRLGRNAERTKWGKENFCGKRKKETRLKNCRCV